MNFNFKQKKELEKLLEMQEGYVLNFSNFDFANFFQDFDIDIYDEKYSNKGNSKANRLRDFFDTESEDIVFPVLRELLKYGKKDIPDFLKTTTKPQESIEELQEQVENLSEQLSAKQNIEKQLKELEQERNNLQEEKTSLLENNQNLQAQIDNSTYGDLVQTFKNQAIKNKWLSILFIVLIIIFISIITCNNTLRELFIDYNKYIFYKIMLMGAFYFLISQYVYFKNKYEWYSYRLTLIKAVEITDTEAKYSNLRTRFNQKLPEILFSDDTKNNKESSLKYPINLKGIDK
jgi:DNA repair exonuclease SbcCD ATPase subunit